MAKTTKKKKLAPKPRTINNTSNYFDCILQITGPEIVCTATLRTTEQVDQIILWLAAARAWMKDRE